MKKLLIFSQAITGHNVEYLEYLYTSLKKNKINSIILTLEPILNSNIIKPNRTIEVTYLNKYPNINTKTNLAKRLNDFCNQEAINHVLFMQLDIVLLPMFLKKNLNCTVSAIYFEHFVRYSLINKWRFWARGVKYITPLVFNPRVKSLFILNDKSGTKILNLLFFFRKKFCFLSDPIDFSHFSNQDNLQLNIKQKYSLTDKKVITCIGSLDERKNTVNVIKSLSLLSETTLNKTALAILGKAKKNEYSNINKAILETTCDNKNIRIIFENRRLTSKEFNDVIFQSDILAIPYSGHVGSSGILGNAVKYKKPVIASNSGLIAKLVKKYHLGLTVNEKSPKAISSAIEKIILYPENLNEKGIHNYMSNLSPFPQSFSSQIIQRISKKGNSRRTDDENLNKTQN